MAVVESVLKSEPETEDVQSSEVQIVTSHSSIDRGGVALHMRLKRSKD